MEESRTQGIMRKGIFHDRQSVCPQVLIAIPIAHLSVGDEGQRQQRTHCRDCPPNRADFSCLCQVIKAPGNHYEDSDEQDVGIAIRPAGLPHLHQTDDRNQSAQEPKPSNRQLALVTKVKYERGDTYQNRRG